MNARVKGGSAQGMGVIWGDGSRLATSVWGTVAASPLGRFEDRCHPFVASEVRDLRRPKPLSPRGAGRGTRVGASAQEYTDRLGGSGLGGREQRRPTVAVSGFA